MVMRKPCYKIGEIIKPLDETVKPQGVFIIKDIIANTFYQMMPINSQHWHMTHTYNCRHIDSTFDLVEQESPILW